MESIFNLDEPERSSILRKIIESCGFDYICLWSHFPHHSKCLIFIDGIYKEENNQESSSSGSLAMRSFLEYKKSMFLVDNYSGRVPGFAFMHNLSYVKHTGLELLELASSPEQLQFYQEASIKTAIFMGCKNGEIELGISNSSSKVINEVELKKLFPGDFPQVLPQPLDQTQASSSPPPFLRSLSMGNNVSHPPFVFNMLHTSSCSTMRSQNPLQLIPSREHVDAEITRAILAAISSPLPLPPPSMSQLQAPRAAGAFKKYQTYLGPVKRVQNQQNLNRRSLLFLRNRSEARTQQGNLMVYTTRPANSQRHHMISERKRREKLNESFQALRSLLPPGSKKDKTSVLSNIKEYIASLKSQIDELSKRNKILETDYTRKETLDQDSDHGFSDERSKIIITEVDGITSDSQSVDLEVNVRGNLILSVLVVRILEFMNQVENVTITSVDAGTRMLETEATTNQVVLRFIIQGSEWNRSTFQEALTRVLDDLTQ
ncbi:putative transcription factor bHLH041 [Bidens hawaiensis]|uniref:putative transcription factor bHLH041 n=1 Tax=Bidens hawaiensis TaxID=980011 RepID=UPI00404B5D1F